MQSLRHLERRRRCYAASARPNSEASTEGKMDRWSQNARESLRFAHTVVRQGERITLEGEQRENSNNRQGTVDPSNTHGCTAVIEQFRNIPCCLRFVNTNVVGRENVEQRVWRRNDHTSLIYRRPTRLPIPVLPSLSPRRCREELRSPATEAGILRRRTAARRNQCSYFDEGSGLLLSREDRRIDDHLRFPSMTVLLVSLTGYTQHLLSCGLGGCVSGEVYTF